MKLQFRRIGRYTHAEYCNRVNHCGNIRFEKDLNKVMYISGKITGLAVPIYTHKFNYVESVMSNYRKIINPLKIYTPIKTWFCYIIVDIWHLVIHADDIVMLDNWRDSKGAKIEHFVAQLFGKNIYYL